MRKIAVIAALASAVFPAAAGAAPVLNLEIHHAQTNFPPGGAVATPSVNTETQGSSAGNEVQRVLIPASKGKFNLCFDPDAGGPGAAQCTADLAFDASGATVQAALRALPAIGSPNVDVSSAVQGASVYDVSFTGDLAKTNVSQLQVASAAAPNDLRRGPELWLEIVNVGPDPTSGPLTLTVQLPAGITRNSVRFNNFLELDPAAWSCPGSPGALVITCTGPGSIPRHRASRSIVILLDVNPAFDPGTVRTVTAKVSGGGAGDAPAAAGCAAGIAACASEPVTIEPTPAPFGIIAASFTPDFVAANGVTPRRAAGGRPELLDVPFDFTTVDDPQETNPYWKAASEPIHDLSVDLPPGFLGDPTAVGECSAAAFVADACPRSSQVGFILLKTQLATGTLLPSSGIQSWTRPVYNLIHPDGVLSDLGFSILSNPVHIRAALDPANGYAITTEVPDLNETIDAYSQKLTIWGVPADPVHDFQRCLGAGDGFDTSKSCPSDGPLKPFLTMPFRCGTEMAMRFHHYDSWLQIGDYGSPIDRELGQFTDCDQVPFAPSVSIAPTTNAADSPAGLDVQIELPQHNTCDPGPPVSCEIATSPLKDASVVLPKGLTVNPASANGLGACSPAQIALGSDDPVQCPDASKVASVQVTTPALPDPVPGTVYLATPHQNPFDSLLAGYIVLADPDRGLLVKIPGEISLDAASGQITGTFKDNPQLPFSEFELHFKGGAHASLITPPTCAEYTANAQFSPWSGNAAVSPTSSFAITQSPAGACAGAEAQLPNSPSFDAGPLSPVSKRYSPFVLHLRRQDGSQRFGAFNVTLPQGLTGKLAGTALCSDGALVAAQSKSGTEEQAAPSCPAASHVGQVVAAAGAGPSPYHARGDAYLAGPYKGAPISLAVITPAVAGPFDLGTIVIRTPLRIDPTTAQITAVSDPIPQMLEGIPTAVRSVHVIMDRPEFTLTGTSCNPAQLNGLLSSTLGQSVPLAVRYQLSDCTRLPFKPKMRLRLEGKTGRGGHPALTVVLEPRPGDANIASLSLAMPRSEFLDQGHIKTICTRVQFAADQCPAGAVYGQVTVSTPLLDYPLSGNVYLRSSSNVLPDLVPDLRGPAHQPIKVEAAGRTDSIRGGIRNTFDFVPDAPFTKLVTKLPGAKKGLLVNSRDICARTYRATVKYTAHNGLTYTDHPKLAVKCKGKSKGGKGRSAKRHRAVR